MRAAPAPISRASTLRSEREPVLRRLVIDTATEACSVALFDGTSLLAAMSQHLGRGHAEALVPMIAELPDKGRADAIHVNCGPGSFTGIRVGLAAATGLQLAWNCTLSGYATHDLLHHMARALRPDGGAMCVAITGGHGEFFVQRFACDGTSVGPLQSLKPDAAAALAAHDLVVGSAADALVTQRGFGKALPLWPQAEQALPMIAAGVALPPVPIYGRGADAKPMRAAQGQFVA